MSRNLYYLIVMVSVVFLVGCSTKIKFDRLQPIINNQGILYVYIPQQSGLNASYKILIDNIPNGNIRNKSYRYFVLSPGKHWITLEGINVVDLYVTVKPRSYTFIRLIRQEGGKELAGLIPTPLLFIPIVRRQKLLSAQLVKSRLALSELKYLHYLQQPTKR